MASRHSPRTGSRIATENLETIKARDRAIARQRSTLQRFSDAVINALSGAPSIIFHALVFGLWIAVNTGWVPGVAPFDPFPFQLLTMGVSLEAIFLALFVLESQNRLSKQSHQRANLDLQIDLLAEHEMTAVLQLLNDIATHLKVNTSVSSEQLDDMIKETDVRRLAEEVER